MIYERISDGGISIVSFTDRDQTNVGEAIDWNLQQ